MAFALVALACYLLATAVLVRSLAIGRDGPRGWIAPAGLALLFHAGFHVAAWHEAAGLDLHFFAALSLVGLGMATLTTLVGANGRLAALGGEILPLAAASLNGSAANGHVRADGMNWRQQ